MDEEEQVCRIKDGDNEAFENLFFTYYKRLCSFAFKVVQSHDLARDCVQEVFLKIWRNREYWQVKHSLPAYLYQSVRNQALNTLQKKKTQRKYTKKYYEQEFNEPKKDVLSERQRSIIKAIWSISSTMPPRRKMVFELHREHGLSYKEIARVMDISKKTVENHMGLALQDIREKLACEKSYKN